MTEMEWLGIFAGNLREIIDESGYSIAEVCKETGLSQPTLNRYLNKKQMPTAKAIVNLYYGLGCDLSDLLDFGDFVE